MKPGAPLALLLLLLPRLAQACPMCANQRPGGVARTVALGVMLLLPFAIAWLVFGALRRTSRGALGTDATARAATDAGGERAGGLRELNP